jgi:serine protease Do
MSPDAILSVNGNTVADKYDLARQITGFSPNTNVDVRILRGQKEQSIPVKLGKLPKGLMARIESDEHRPVVPMWIEMKLGLKVAPGTGANKDDVVVTEVDNSSDAAKKGIKTSDVILGVGSLTVKHPEDVANGLKEAMKLDRKAVLVRIKSGDKTRFVAVQLKKS